MSAIPLPPFVLPSYSHITWTSWVSFCRLWIWDDPAFVQYSHSHNCSSYQPYSSPPFCDLKLFDLISFMEKFKDTIKYFSKHLNFNIKNFDYLLLDSNSLILTRTVFSSVSISCLYFLRDSKLESLSSFSLNLPVP